MARIYDHNGETLTEGLQGCTVCDEAIILAQRMADRRGQPVQLEDDDGTWLVHPSGPDGTRQPADPIEENADSNG